MDKKNFIGKDALIKQKSEGIKNKLCTITLDDDRTIVIGKEPIRIAEKLVGWVASGGFGYSVNKSIAYAYLPLEYAKAGTKLEVDCFGEQMGAEVAPAVLWDAKGERIRQ